MNRKVLRRVRYLLVVLIASAAGRAGARGGAGGRQGQTERAVTSTTTYCSVDGNKVGFDEDVYRRFNARGQDAKVKCWKDGKLVTDVEFRDGRRTGYVTHSDENPRACRTSYRDNKRHGEEACSKDGKPFTLASYDDGKLIWQKEFHPNGKIKIYSRQFKDGYGGFSQTDDGKVAEMRCTPSVRDDNDLRQMCGFNGVATTSLYDGAGKVSRVLTWKDGVIQKMGAGETGHGPGIQVAFKNGKKHGEERVLDRDGKLKGIINWDGGIKDGKEVAFAADGKKVVKEIIWKAGETQQVTEYYLNGNPRLKETYDGPKKKQVWEFWDTGKPARAGSFVLCVAPTDEFSRGDWCAEGLHKEYFESGAPRSEATLRLGKREGSSQTWWDNGKLESVKTYADDKLTKAKRWDKDGKLLADEEFEADGSRKLK